MSPSPPTGPPLILSPESIPEFLRCLIDHHTPPTTLVVCSTRDTLLHQLMLSIPQTPSEDPHVGLHPLLNPTIGLLAATRTISIVYVPTLQHLRAWLATYVPPVVSSEPRLSNSGTPFLAVLNPIALHRSTSDFSAQGIGRTFAGIVEAAAREGMRLLVAECRELSEDDDIDVLSHSPNVWQEQVPLLNGTARPPGAGGELVVSGRTASVGRVVGRWCVFEGGDTGTF
ncbi:MAG: hypothetical protein M1832_005331 [Thelocarpon impressellum]|nr:MAG: hypothetical protein M1832_005331 [Thelocarpon impressellum]